MRFGSRFTRRRLLPTALAVVACGSPSPQDGGTDSGTDSGVDSGVDAGHDAGTDAGFDAGTDAGFDAGTDAGFDGGVCPHPDTGDAGTVRCTCEVAYFPDGGMGWSECCDSDIGNPCPICCLNPRGADGGRVYYPGDSGTPVCYC